MANAVIDAFEAQTGRRILETKCKNCTNAVWRMMPQAAAEEPYDYQHGGKALLAQCKIVGVLRGPVDCCTDYVNEAESIEKQGGLADIV